MSTSDRVTVRRVRKKRGAYHHGSLRESLVEAALDIIATAGIDGLSLRDVARQLGVSHQAPYRHFADKRALLEAIAADGFLALTTALREAIAPDDDPILRLIEIGFVYVRFAKDHAARYRVMFAEPASPQGTPPAESTGDTAFHVLVETIRYGQTRAAFARVSPYELALASFAFVHGLAMLVIDAKMADVRDAHLRALIEHHVRGIVSRRAAG